MTLMEARWSAVIGGNANGAAEGRRVEEGPTGEDYGLSSLAELSRRSSVHRMDGLVWLLVIIGGGALVLITGGWIVALVGAVGVSVWERLKGDPAAFDWLRDRWRL